MYLARLILVRILIYCHIKIEWTKVIKVVVFIAIQWKMCERYFFLVVVYHSPMNSVTNTRLSHLGTHIESYFVPAKWRHTHSLKSKADIEPVKQ